MYAMGGILFLYLMIFGGSAVALIVFLVAFWRISRAQQRIAGSLEALLHQGRLDPRPPRSGLEGQ